MSQKHPAYRTPEEDNAHHAQEHKRPNTREQATAAILNDLSPGLGSGTALFGSVRSASAPKRGVTASKARHAERAHASGSDTGYYDLDQAEAEEDGGEEGERHMVLTPLQYAHLNILDRENSRAFAITESRWIDDWFMRLMFLYDEEEHLVYRYTELDRLYKRLIDVDSSCGDKASGFCGGLMAVPERTDLYRVFKPIGWCVQTRYKTWDEFLAVYNAGEDTSMVLEGKGTWRLRAPWPYKKIEEEGMMWLICCWNPDITRWLLSEDRPDSPPKKDGDWLKQFIKRGVPGCPQSMRTFIDTCMKGRPLEPGFITWTKYVHGKYQRIFYGGGTVNGRRTAQHQRHLEEMKEASNERWVEHPPPFPPNIDI